MAVSTIGFFSNIWRQIMENSPSPWYSTAAYQVSGSNYTRQDTNSTGGYIISWPATFTFTLTSTGNTIYAGQIGTEQEIIEAPEPVPVKQPVEQPVEQPVMVPVSKRRR